MADLEKIVKLLQVIEKSCEMIKEEIGIKSVKNSNISMNLVDNERIKYVNRIVKENNWPEIVPGYKHVEISEWDQMKRAKIVLDLLNIQKGDNLLDFGCGEGWVANEASTRGIKNVVGYDIAENILWSNFKNATFTTNFNELESKQFDIILLYDVLDHCMEPFEILDKIKQVLSPDGCVYIRFHPWTACHGSHIIKQGINKAFLHLFLNWDEMKDVLGAYPIFTRNETDPLTAYRYWLQDFEIIEENIKTRPVDKFFFNHQIKSYIAKEQNIKNIDDFLNNKMTLEFIDYKIKRK